MSQFEDRSPYRVAVQQDFIADGVSITFGMRYPNGSMRILRFGDNESMTWEEHEPYTMIDKPTMRLQDDFARALYAELGRYYGAQADDTRLLRKDYDDERLRVNAMMLRYHELAMRSIEAFEAGL